MYSSGHAPSEKKTQKIQRNVGEGTEYGWKEWLGKVSVHWTVERDD